MQNEKTPYSKWRDCLDQFSRAHHGQMVRVQTFHPETGINCNIEDLPLLGVTLEQGPNGSRTITIEAGNAANGLFAHSVELPVEIRSAEWNDGVSSALDIQSADEQITRVQVGPTEQVLAPGVVTDGAWERE